MGAWSYVQPRFHTALKNTRTIKWEKQKKIHILTLFWNIFVHRYAGRAPSSSPATGNKYQHTLEQRHVIANSLNIREKQLKSMKKWNVKTIFHFWAFIIPLLFKNMLRCFFANVRWFMFFKLKVSLLFCWSCKFCVWYWTNGVFNVRKLWQNTIVTKIYKTSIECSLTFNFLSFFFFIFRKAWLNYIWRICLSKNELSNENRSTKFRNYF